MTDLQTLVEGVDFISVASQDLDAAEAFYGGTLGLVRSAVYQRGETPPLGMEFETGNLTLSIIDPEKMGLTHVVSQNAIALHVDDIEAARALLEQRGVSFAGDTFDTGVCHMAFFHDPDGNALMLHHRYAPRVTETSTAG